MELSKHRVIWLYCTVVYQSGVKISASKWIYPNQERLLRAVPLVADHRVHMRPDLGRGFACQPFSGTEQGSTDAKQSLKCVHQVF